MKWHTKEKKKLHKDETAFLLYKESFCLKYLQIAVINRNIIILCNFDYMGWLILKTSKLSWPVVRIDKMHLRGCLMRLLAVRIDWLYTQQGFQELFTLEESVEATCQEKHKHGMLCVLTTYNLGITKKMSKPGCICQV